MKKIKSKLNEYCADTMFENILDEKDKENKDIKELLFKISTFLFVNYTLKVFCVVNEDPYIHLYYQKYKYYHYLLYTRKHKKIEK